MSTSCLHHRPRPIKAFSAGWCVLMISVWTSMSKPPRSGRQAIGPSQLRVHVTGMSKLLPDVRSKLRGWSPNVGLKFSLSRPLIPEKLLANIRWLKYSKNQQLPHVQLRFSVLFWRPKDLICWWTPLFQGWFLSMSAVQYTTSCRTRPLF